MADTRRALLLLAVLAVASAYGPLFWPQPRAMTKGTDNFTIDPCRINYKVTTVPVYLVDNINLYLIETFKCKKGVEQQLSLGRDALNVTLTVTVLNTTLIPPLAGFENYTLNLTSDGNWLLRANFFPGFLRGFETFAQIFKQDENSTYYVEALPMNISDGPEFQWRGIMIDSSRHFLPVDVIKRTIDGCLYNKVNVMHWHITDEDSFPLEIKSHPELSGFGSFNNQTYTKENVADIIQYALRKGVRIIPEIDSPAHTQAWGRSPQLENITLTCPGGPYTGQFDPTLDLTYQVIEDVLREVNEMFIDSVVHFGGDEVELLCWDLRPSIKEWMIKNKIPTYKDLEIYYRNRQKQIWRKISNKTASYWANEDIDLPTEADDYIHWWGVSKNVRQLENRTNNIVLSNYDITYLDIGYGGRTGGIYGNSIETWR